jgi:RNA polymerase sporulation-specific sigma factor
LGDDENDGLSLLDKMSSHIDEANVLTNKLCIQQAINNLKDNEKQIIFLRYYKGKTQTEIAKIMGITQVQVSRIEKRVLENMRVKLAI